MHTGLPAAMSAFCLRLLCGPTPPHLHRLVPSLQDNTSFVHIVQHEDATATLLSVTLLTPDTLDAATASGAASVSSDTATVVLGTTAPRVHAVLMQHAGVATQRPLLLYLTQNITLDAPGPGPAPSSSSVNRPVYFIGLVSTKTSIDFLRTPNQLNLTGSRLGRVYLLSVALENMGYGNELSTWYAGLYSPLIIHNLWAVLVDRWVGWRVMLAGGQRCVWLQLAGCAEGWLCCTAHLAAAQTAAHGWPSSAPLQLLRLASCCNSPGFARTFP